MFKAFYNLGYCLDNHGDYRQAIENYEEAIIYTKDKTEKNKVYDKLIFCYIKNV